MVRLQLMFTCKACSIDYDYDYDDYDYSDYMQMQSIKCTEKSDKFCYVQSDTIKLLVFSKQ